MVYNNKIKAESIVEALEHSGITPEHERNKDD